MIDRKLLQQALDALELVTANMLDCRDQLAERGGRPTTNVVHQRLWDAAHKTYTDNAIPVAEAIRARLAQPEQKPVAVFRREILGRGQIFWLRSSDELPNETPLYTASSKKEWVGLTDEEIGALHYELKCAAMGATSTLGMYRILERALREKNT